MCNNDLSSSRWFFNSIESSCGGKNGLGPGVCKYYYYMRFYQGPDGKRQRHSNFLFYTMAIPGAILFPIFSTLGLFAYSFIWAYRATKKIFYKCEIYLYFFTIIVAPLLWIVLIVGVLLFIMIMEMWAFWWTAYAGICKFSNVPLIREELVDEAKPVVYGPHNPCGVCFSPVCVQR